MATGSRGVVIGWYRNTDEVLVRFWDGGPLRVPEDAVQLVDPRRRPLPVDR